MGMPQHRQPPAAGTPDVLIILVDDVGPGLLTPLGGEVAMPNLERIIQAAWRTTVVGG